MVRLLIFDVAGRRFALESKQVQEVISYTDVTPINHPNPSVLGVLNLRSETITAIDLHVLLWQGDPSPITPKTCFVLVRLEDLDPVVALLVDHIEGLSKFEDADLLPPPSVGGTIQVDYVKSVLVEENGVNFVLQGSAIGKRIDARSGVDVVEVAIP